MDSSSRKIVTFIAVVTIIVMAAMAIRSYLDADQSKAAAPAEATEDSAPEAPKREPTQATKCPLPLQKSKTFRPSLANRR